MDTARMLDNRGEEPPVYTYEAVPGVPPVSVLRFRGWEFPPGEPPPGHAHSHDFLVLCYFGRGGGDNQHERAPFALTNQHMKVCSFPGLYRLSGERALPFETPP